MQQMMAGYTDPKSAKTFKCLPAERLAVFRVGDFLYPGFYFAKNLDLD